MDKNVLYVIFIVSIINLIPLFDKIYNNKISTGLINFVNAEMMSLLWIFVVSYFKNYKTIYMLLLYSLIIFQLVFLSNKYFLKN